MAANVVRKRNCILAVKHETVAGVDAWAGAQADPATDCLRGDVTIALEQSQAQNTEMTGSLDDAPPLAAGTKGTITVSVMLRGSGTPGTPPKFGVLMPLCSYTETAQAAAIPATAAASGTATGITLAAPYLATPQKYRGLPVTLTGNPVAAAHSFIVDQPSLSAKLAHSYSPVLSSATLASIPANVLYSPSSDPNDAVTGTVLVYIDGLAWRFTGCAGTWTLDMPVSSAGTLKFTLTGTFFDMETAAMPADPVVDTTQPPIYIAGIARLDHNLIRVSKFNVDSGGTVIQPENPESAQGFDPSVITKRNSTGSIDPLMSVTETAARTMAFSQGTYAPLVAGLGSAVGNRFGIIAPAVMFTANSPSDRNNLMAESITFDCTGSDSGVFLVQY